MATLGSITTGTSQDTFPTRCIATDQSGKHRVIVTPPLSDGGKTSENGRQLRFVIMQQAELEHMPKSQTRKYKNRTQKFDLARKVALPTQADPMADMEYLKLGALDGLPPDKPQVSAITLHHLAYSMLPPPITGDLQRQLLHVYVPVLRMAAQNEELYQAFMIVALAFKEMRSGRLALTPGIAWHSSQSVARLRNKLDDLKACPDDAMMLTITLLTDASTKYGTCREFIAHYHGLRRMVDMRGGLKALESNPALTAMVGYVEIIAEMLLIPHDADPRSGVENSSSTEHKLGVSYLHYPAHPFSPDLCNDVANLPEGFRELALSLRLSREVIRLVIAAHRQAFFETGELKYQPIITCPSMILTYARKFWEVSNRVTESIVCLSIIVSSMRSMSFPFETEDLEMVTELASLVSSRGVEESSLDQYYHYVWTVIMAAEACREVPALSVVTQRLLTDLLEPTSRNHLEALDLLADWTKLEKVLKRYLWRYDLLERWKRLWETTLRDLRSTSSCEIKRSLLGSVTDNAHASRNSSLVLHLECI